MAPRSALFAAAIALAATSAVAQEHQQPYKVGSIEIEQPWSRATPKGAAVAGGFMKIKNNGPDADRLLGGSAAFAGRVQVHRMTMDQGVMQMRELKDGLEIKPGETVELRPGAYHLMFLDLKRPLKQGEQVKVTLDFEKAGTIDVDYRVGGIGASPPAPQAHTH